MTHKAFGRWISNARLTSLRGQAALRSGTVVTQDLPRRTPASPLPSSAAPKSLRDPALAAKVEDVTGLYMRSPAHALVLLIDEKPRSRRSIVPSLPLKPGKCGTMTHDYKRHGTTTLFAALNILNGAVIGRCMQQHRHQEFIRFLNAIGREAPAGKDIHAIMDSYGTQAPEVKAWVGRHPRWTFRFTPTSATWLNAVEGFFLILTRQRLRRGAISGIVDLQTANKRYLKEHNADPKPFTWTKPAAEILDKLARLPAPSV